MSAYSVYAVDFATTAYWLDSNGAIGNNLVISTVLSGHNYAASSRPLSTCIPVSAIGKIPVAGLLREMRHVERTRSQWLGHCDAFRRSRSELAESFIHREERSL